MANTVPEASPAEPEAAAAALEPSAAEDGALEPALTSCKPATGPLYLTVDLVEADDEVVYTDADTDTDDEVGALTLLEVVTGAEEVGLVLPDVEYVDPVAVVSVLVVAWMLVVA